MRALPVLVALLVLAPLASAQTLVRDIRPGPEGLGSEPFEAPVVFDGAVYFYADDGVHGSELWRSDGTEVGTVLVKDIRPGPDGSNVFQIFVFDGALYFSANDGVHGSEIWRSDGTEAGTVLFKDLRPGPGSGGMGEAIVFDGALYFNGTDDMHGSELWRTDGTETGTVLVKDLIPGGEGRPRDFVVLGDLLVFTAEFDLFDRELWVSDGTVDGTGLLLDINQRTDTLFRGSDPFGMTPYQGRLYFSADNGEDGHELWSTDGTTDGTEFVRDLYPGDTPAGVPGDGFPGGFTEYDGLLYFGAVTAGGVSLWRTDGTRDGTVFFADPNPSTASFPGVRLLTVFDDALFFSVSDGTTGMELWRTDGTQPGTELFVDINPGEASSRPRVPVVAGGRLYVVAETDAAGRELWASDGTAGGTAMVADIHPGPGDGLRLSVDSPILQIGNTLFFTADDGTHGFELWTYDLLPTAAEPPPIAGLDMTVAPNPASGAATIRLTLAEPAVVSVEVLDLLGRRIATLWEGPLAAGAHRLAWDGPGAPAGVYLVRAATPGGVQMERITRVR